MDPPPKTETIAEDGPERLWRAAPFLLLLLSVAVHGVVAFRAVLVHNDSVLYLDMARLFLEGRVAEGLAYPYHPAPSAAMALFGTVFPDLVSAGYASVVVFSSLTVLPLYGLARDLFSRPVALTTGLVYIFLPTFLLLGSSVLSEGLYFFCFATAVWAFHKARAKGDFRAGALAGLAAGGAYLCRPEGGGLVLLFLIWTAVEVLKTKRLPWKRGAVLALLVLAAFFGPAFPYLCHIRGQTGEWQVSKKKTIANLTGMEKVVDRDIKSRLRTAKVPSHASEEPRKQGPPRFVHKPLHYPASVPLRGAHSFWIAGNILFQVLFFVPPLLVFWVLIRRRGKLSDRLYLLSILGFYFALCLAFHATHHYLSRRHLSAPALMALPLIARGLLDLARIGAPSVARLWRRPAEKVRPALAVGIVAILLLCCIPKGLSPYGRGKEYLRTAGEAIGSILGPGGTLLGSEKRLALYAGAWFAPLPDRDGLLALAEAVDASGARAVTVNFDAEPFLRDYPLLAQAFWSSAPPGYELILTLDAKGNGRPIRVFRVLGKGGGS
jgi:4-amino-4-deoxy-L-arabinose transferase-like glycosyltransferase